MANQKEYYKENIIEINKKNNQYDKNRRSTDASFRLKKAVSASIRSLLKKNDSSKNGKSVKKYLPYTFEQLENHLEDLFAAPENLTPDGKIWMHRENQGAYIPTKWDDDDPSTWVWQLDHIIPHSTFKYTSMDSQEFRDAWDLTNLRPLSAQRNFLDGVNRTRHPKENK